MAETLSSPVVNKRGGWLRKLGIIFAVLAVLIVVAWFVVTSGAFFKGVILPRVAKAMNVELTVEDAAISPFSQVTLRGLTVRTTGTEPLVTAQEVRARYSLKAILGGNILVEEVALLSPKVTIINGPGKESNLDPLTKSSSPEPEKKPASTSAGKPPQIDIRKVLLQNASVRVIQNHPGGKRDLTELANLNLAIDNLKNGQTAKFTMSAEVTVDQNPPAPGTNGMLQARIEGAFDIGLAADLNLAALKGGLKFSVAKSGGAFAALSDFATSLDTDLTPTEIKQVALSFTKAGAELARLRASGPFSLAKQEGTINLELLPADQRLLNLAGTGLDFGRTLLAMTNQFVFSEAGQRIVARGRVDLTSFSLKTATATTPTLDLKLAYDADVNRAAESVVLRALDFRGEQEKRPLLLASLSNPMTIAWGNTANAVGDATLAVVLTNLNLGDWHAFAPEFEAVGTAGAMFKLVSRKAGRELAFDVAASIQNLNALVASNRLSDVALTMALSGDAAEFKKYRLSTMRMDVARQGAPVVTMTGGGVFEPAGGTNDLSVSLDLFPGRLLAMLPQPGWEVSGGRAQMTAKVTQRGAAQSFTGTLGLDSFTGRHGQAAFTNLGANIIYDVVMPSALFIDVKNFALIVPPTVRVKTNAVTFSGKMDLSRSNAIEGALKLTSEAFDLTPWMDLASGEPAPAARTTPVSATPPPAPTGGEKEPEPVVLPVKLISFEAAFGRLCLREIEMSNVLASVRVERSRVQIQPFQCALNGAPVRGEVDLDLALPGWRYAVNFNAVKIPLEPLANSFSPEYRGRAKGELAANIQLQGMGVTGPSLQKNLGGSFGLVFTNADIQLVSSRWKSLLVPIGLALRTDLMQSPVRWLAFNGSVATGKFKVSQCSIVSGAFTADTSGEIPLAAVLTNSPFQPKWPLQLALARSLAETSRLVPANAPTNTPYVALPVFATIVGTIGEPKPDIDKLAVAQILSGAVLNIPGIQGTDAGKVLNKVSGLLGGGTPASRDTNAPPTNKPAALNPLDLLNRLKK